MPIAGIHRRTLGCFTSPKKKGSISKTFSRSNDPTLRSSFGEIFDSEHRKIGAVGLSDRNLSSISSASPSFWTRSCAERLVLIQPLATPPDGRLHFLAHHLVQYNFVRHADLLLSLSALRLVEPLDDILGIDDSYYGVELVFLLERAVRVHLSKEGLDYRG